MLVLDVPSTHSALDIVLASSEERASIYIAAEMGAVDEDRRRHSYGSTHSVAGVTAALPALSSSPNRREGMRLMIAASASASSVGIELRFGLLQQRPWQPALQSC